jgi:homogentisate 1,2-dioxygenase
MNSDGEFLFVPQIGGIEILTEMGRLEVSPSEVAVVPRGVKFQVNPLSKSCRGYIAENYGSPLRLPYLGPIGANGLAQPRDFQAPKAQFHEEEGVFELLCKFDGTFWKTKLNHNPLDVVAWHGNYYPYRYDLKKFNTINTVSFDHPDPSIFTVLTSPSEIPGTANLDFVIFPPRWMVAEKTFRPPYYHRNIMSEFMGLIHGVYDAKETGFVPGGSSLHNCMASHGPDTEALIKGTDADLKPQYLGDTLAFMFESVLAFYPTKRALDSASLQKDYYRCWQGIPKRFHSS